MEPANETAERVRLPHKILAALDGSDTSLKASEYAGLIAGVTHARVVFVHAILVPEGTTDVFYQTLSSKAEKFLEEAAKPLKSKGISVEWKLLRADRSVVGSIIDYADHWGADFVVVGTKGVSGYGKMVLGSVAAGVVSLAHCPVLAVR